MKKIIIILIVFVNSIQNTFSGEAFTKKDPREVTKFEEIWLKCKQYEFTSEQWRENLKHLQWREKLKHSSIDHPGINYQGYNGLTALHAAVRDKDTSFIEELLSKSVNVDSTCFGGGTPLAVAVDNADIECAKLLLSKGANPDLTNLAGISPLWKAFYVSDQKSREELTSLLITKTSLKEKDLKEIKISADEWRRKQLLKRVLNK